MAFKASIIFSLFLFLSSYSYAEARKKNVCTITINSTEETELFKKHLNPQDWNFTELTANALDANDSSWLKRSCDKKTECDILLISGHFGGVFFGSSPFNLSVDELEARSCDSNCDGILHKPKEVFLFGCNTLAEKDKDNRSPEEYMQVLLRDGFSYAQASQIVSFRYSSFGDSFKTKMSAVFAKTPRIYGFNSKGPAGKTISPLLNKYLSATQDDYRNFDAYVKQNKSNLNLKLAQALKNTSFVQSEGSLPTMKTVEDKPYCYIRSDKISNTEKLNTIEKYFNSGIGIKMLSHIQNYLHNLKSDSVRFGPAEKAVFARLQKNEKIKTELLNLLKLEGDVYMPLKVNVINTLKDLEFISAKQAQATLNRLIDLSTPFTLERQDFICSSDFTANITAADIPEARWKETYFISSLLCLKPQDPQILNHVAKNLHSSNQLLVANSIWFLRYMSAINESHLRAIAKRLERKNDFSVAFAVLVTLRDLAPNKPEFTQAIINSIPKETDRNVLDLFNQALGQIFQRKSY